MNNNTIMYAVVFVVVICLGIYGYLYQKKCEFGQKKNDFKICSSCPSTTNAFSKTSYSDDICTPSSCITGYTL